MDNFTTFGLILLGACALGLTTCLALVALRIAGHLSRRQAMRALGGEVAALTAAYAARPAERHRHNAHCPACGKFARVTSSGDWGVRTRCKTHGMRLRAARLVGERERTLIRVTVHSPIVRIESAAVTSPLTLSMPVRSPDWLDDAETYPLRILRPALAA